MLRRLPWYAARLVRLFTVLLLEIVTLGRALGDEPKSIILPAEQLASASQRADVPTPGKWWQREVVAEFGNAVLLTGKIDDRPIAKEHLREWGVVPPEHFTTAYRVPALEIDPKLKGWHRIELGMVQDARDQDGSTAPFHPRLWGRLSDEPFPEYLQTPQDAPRDGIARVIWRSADLTGKKIIIEQPPASMMHPGRGWYGGISHITLTPLTEKEIAQAKRDQRLPPVDKRLFGMLDLPDEIWWYGSIESAQDMKGVIYRHEKAGFGRVYLRCWGSHLDTSHDVPDANPRWTAEQDEAYKKANRCGAGWRAYLDLPKKFDPLKVAVDYGNERGIEVHAWIRLTNLNRPPYAEFWHKHPEYQAKLVSRDAKTGELRYSSYSRVLSFAHPEVRSFYVKLCKQMASTGTKGILLDLLRHPPLAGFEEITVKAYKEKHGEDLLARITPKTDGVGLLIHDTKVVAVLADFLEEFLRELRKEVGPEIEITVRSSGPDKYGLRGKAWIDAGLIQTIIDGHWYSGRGPRPTIDATIAAVGSKGHAYAIADPGNVDPRNWSNLPGTLSPEAILALARYYREKGVHRFGLYETTDFCWRPECRRAIREAGRIMSGE